MSNDPIDLKIHTKYDKASKSISLHENLPSIPFYLNAYGGGTSGKTLMVVNLIYKMKSVFKKKRVFIFTNSYSETLFDLANTRGAYIYTDIENETGENRIEKILEFQNEMKQKHGKCEQILLVFDDFISNAEFNKRRGIFTKLFSMARHFNVSIILTSQQFTLIPATIRRLALYNIFYKINNKQELKLMLNENNGFLDENEFKKVYQIATKGKYNFRFCQVRKNRMLKNFTEVLAEENADGTPLRSSFGNDNIEVI